LYKQIKRGEAPRGKFSVKPSDTSNATGTKLENRSLLQDDQPEPVDAGPAASGTEDIVEEFRNLPPFERVTSCVPVSVLVLAQSPSSEVITNGEAAVEEDAAAPATAEEGTPSPYRVWVSANSGAVAALKAEVEDSTLSLYFRDADFATSEPIKVVVLAPEDALKGVHNAGVISRMVVAGFSPPEEFEVVNSSPLGSLVLDDMDAPAGIAVKALGSGMTAIMGQVDRVAVMTRGTTGDIVVDGVGTELTVDLEGTGNVFVTGTENVLITGRFFGAAGVVSFTKGNCTITHAFDEEPGEEPPRGFLRGGDTAGMVSGCVRIPDDVAPEDAAPSVDDFMFWTCGLEVRGTFDCLRGDAAKVTEAMDIGGRRGPFGRRRGVTVQGRAVHGAPESRCREDITIDELSMMSAVEGMDLETGGSNLGGPPEELPSQENERPFGVVEAV